VPPLDDVEEEALQWPVHWDLTLIQRFMLVLGPVSRVLNDRQRWFLDEMAIRSRLCFTDIVVQREVSAKTAMRDVAGPQATGRIVFGARKTGLYRVSERVEFTAPVTVVPGENGPGALAEGKLHVLNGEETASRFVKARCRERAHWRPTV
jgi:hypothetical protein